MDPDISRPGQKGRRRVAGWLLARISRVDGGMRRIGFRLGGEPAAWPRPERYKINNVNQYRKYFSFLPGTAFYTFSLDFALIPGKIYLFIFADPGREMLGA